MKIFSRDSKKLKAGLNLELAAKGCGCFLALLVLASCIFLSFIIVKRPAFITNNVATFLNDGANYQEFKDVTKSDLQIEQEITSQVKGLGENDIFISEEDLTLFLRNKFTQLKDLSVDLEDGEARIYWKLDDSTNPILGEAILTYSQGGIRISQLGTPRLHFPGLFYPAINNLAYRLIDQQALKNQLGLATIGDTLKIEDVKFLKDKVYLQVLVSIKVF